MVDRPESAMVGSDANLGIAAWNSRAEALPGPLFENVAGDVQQTLKS